MKPAGSRVDAKFWRRQTSNVALQLPPERLVLVSRGPGEAGWRGRYCRCPLCNTFVDRAQSGGCACGNLLCDADAGRLSVRRSAESDVEVYSSSDDPLIR